MSTKTEERPNMNPKARNGSTPTASAPQGKIEDNRDPRLPTRHADPASVPLGTDAEAGGDRPVVPSSEPADTYLVDAKGDVRAGPGDAGRQDAPRMLDGAEHRPAPSYSTLVGICVAIIAVLLIAFLVTR